jgi:hypothetical protein
MRDFAELTERILRALGKARLASPDLFNIPGRSLLLKIDPHYYLAPWPALGQRLGRLAALLPRVAEDALARTATLVTCGPQRQASLPLRLEWPGGAADIRAAFLLAASVDHGLALYAGLADPLPVCAARIADRSREAVLAFFADKTPPHASAFTPPA